MHFCGDFNIVANENHVTSFFNSCLGEISVALFFSGWSRINALKGF